jgi:hypothetical protein
MNVTLILGLVGGVLVSSFVIASWAAGAAKKAHAREWLAFAEEGVVLDSGKRVGLRARLRDFRAGGGYTGAGVRIGVGRVVLTRRRLVTWPMGRNRSGLASFERDALARCTVGVVEGKLVLTTDAPPIGTGHAELTFAVAEPETWRDRLAEMGARPV